ncbi:hypothetical protein CUMW_232150, partial [Citrus unshiu]
MIFINLSHPTHTLTPNSNFKTPFIISPFSSSSTTRSTALLAQPTAVQPTPTLRLTHLTADSLSQSRSLTHTLRRHPFASDPAAVASISAIASNSSLQYRRLEKVDKLGKAGETVKVAPGYFRNHLMPKLLAVPNIEKFAHLIREQRRICQPVEEEEVKVIRKSEDNMSREFEKAARRLENARLVLRRFPNIEKLRSRASKDDPIELRSPVTKEELVAEVARQLSISIEPENLHLPSPLSAFGEYEVPMRLPKAIPLPEGKVQWTLNVKIIQATFVRHVTPHSLLRHFPLTQHFLPKQIPSLKNRIFSFTTTATMSSTSKKVLVPVANGSEPIEAVITIDVLRRSGADVTVASVEKQLRVDACHGVKIVADALVSDCRDAVFDLIALPKSIVKKQASAGRLYCCCLCFHLLVALGSWGLLKGIEAPACASTVESRVQQDGKVVTSRGPGHYHRSFAVALVMRANHGDEYTIAEFNPIQWTFDNSPQILVPIANGSEEMEAVMIIDILRRAKANVVVASVEDKLEILASRQVKLVADVLIDEAAKLSYDLIVLPGGLGGAQAFAKSEKLVNMLEKQKESNRPYGAICASPALVLEPHGLLKGKKATAFPAMCNKLSDQSEIENRVVVDGNLITSRGPGTSMEFALAIVEKERKWKLEFVFEYGFTVR